MEWAYVMYIQFVSLESVTHQTGQTPFPIVKFGSTTPTERDIILIDGFWVCIHAASACANCLHQFCATKMWPGGQGAWCTKTAVH